jgi:hypothetical protein
LEEKRVSYRNKTYVVFDGDNDQWAYRFMRGWKTSDRIDFDFNDAHDLGSELTDRASEQTIKRSLRQRFSNAKQVIVIVGEHTKNLCLPKSLSGMTRAWPYGNASGRWSRF